MKVTRKMLRQLIMEALDKNEVKERDIRKIVIATLRKEGGAAGMDLLVKAVKSLETKTKKLPKKLKNNKAISRCILKMDDIVKHSQGDIILTIGLPKKR
jgi:ribosomal protein L5